MSGPSGDSVPETLNCLHNAAVLKLLLGKTALCIPETFSDLSRNYFPFTASRHTSLQVRSISDELSETSLFRLLRYSPQTLGGPFPELSGAGGITDRTVGSHTSRDVRGVS